MEKGLASRKNKPKLADNGDGDETQWKSGLKLRKWWPPPLRSSHRIYMLHLLPLNLSLIPDAIYPYPFWLTAFHFKCYSIQKWGGWWTAFFVWWDLENDIFCSEILENAIFLVYACEKIILYCGVSKMQFVVLGISKIPARISIFVYMDHSGNGIVWVSWKCYFA